MSKKTIPKEEWEKKLKEIKINKNDLNKLVMNYLVIEGYKDAAEMFQEEASADPGIDLDSISDRMYVRTAVQNGDINSAIERVNDINPEILDRNARLYFHLQQQQLIELIRSGDINQAISFAREELAPRGEENPEFLEELEQTMALLAFEDMSSSPVKDLLDHSHRQKTASELNAAILASQCQEQNPKLPTLLKMLIWSQNKLDEKVKYPRINNLTTAKLEEPSSN
eukprot:gb/GECH01013702.1/.p1 GENE.gb/GECH01013702.1/~~gb/GECH01013702.1/.p1  ORF type:complete len:226 (+),score=85.87 gb/GECH01013702.1/:1-678(+)